MKGPPDRERGYGLLRRGAITYARLDDAVRRGQERARRWAEEFLGQALSSQEQATLGVDLYAGGAVRAARGGLWPWEQSWFARRLPASGAVLLGGAGDGREAGVLAQRGYRVDAFEPAEALASSCAEVVGAAGELFCGTYQELSRAVLDGEENLLARLRSRRYDAVILGWGSFTHVLDATDRRRTLETCARLTPRGPILASFWMGEPVDPDAGAAALPVPWARRLGALVGGLRGVQPTDAHNSFGPWCGFAHRFSRDEIEALAAGIDRRVIWESDPGISYPHVTLI